MEFVSLEQEHNPLFHLLGEFHLLSKFHILDEFHQLVQ
jgi:hypothetical protein